MQNLKKVSIIVGLLLVAMLIIVGCGGTTTEPKTGEEGTTPKTETKAVQEGTIYVPGMGGHIAVATIKVDPTAETPIEITKLEKINLGPGTTDATHDARVDKEKGVLYSAAYVKDASGGVSVSSVDLKTLQVLKKVSIDVDARYVGGPMYCGSGQTASMFMPIFMGYEGYIDVIDKETLEKKHRVFFDDLGVGKNYIFAHGVNTPDMKYILLALNATSAERAGQMAPPFPRGDGNFLLFLLDAAELEQGKIKVVKSSKVPADENSSIAFRQTFTSDGKYLLQSGRDRVQIIDGNTLELVREVIIPKVEGIQPECHDAIPTADNKYAILALRYPVKVEGAEKPVNDGMLMLVDIAKGEIVGKPSSTCRKCHDDYSSLKTKDANLCGLDATWK